MITYSTEVLYHLKCDKCNHYWNLSDTLPDMVYCTHCGHTNKPENAETVSEAAWADYYFKKWQEANERLSSGT